MLGYAAIGELALGDTGPALAAAGPITPPPEGIIDASTVSAARTVVFSGGVRVVTFQGGTRVVVFGNPQ